MQKNLLITKPNKDEAWTFCDDRGSGFFDFLRNAVWRPITALIGFERKIDGRILVYLAAKNSFKFYTVRYRFENEFRTWLHPYSAAKIKLAANYQIFWGIYT